MKISNNYTKSKTFSGQVTIFTKNNLLKRAKNFKDKANLITQFKNIESNTLEETKIFCRKNPYGLFYFEANNQSLNGSAQRLTKNCEEKDLVDTFLNITVNSINKLEKDLNYNANKASYKIFPVIELPNIK